MSSAALTRQANADGAIAVIKAGHQAANEVATDMRTSTVKSDRTRVPQYTRVEVLFQATSGMVFQVPVRLLGWDHRQSDLVV